MGSRLPLCSCKLRNCTGLHNIAMAAHIVLDAGDPDGESVNQTEPSQCKGSSSIRESDVSEECRPKNLHIVWSRTNFALRRFGAVRVEKGSSYSEDPSSGSLARASSSEDPSRQSNISGGSSQQRSTSLPAKSPPRTLTQGDVTVLLNEQGNPTSIGSANHYEGTCKPCLFVTTHRECRNGLNCTFCHFPHKRPSAGKRGRLRKYMERTESLIDNDPNQIGNITAKLPRSIDQDEKRKKDVIGKLVARANKARTAMGSSQESAGAEHQ